MAAVSEGFVTGIVRWAGFKRLILLSLWVSGCSSAALTSTAMFTTAPTVTLSPAPCTIMSYDQAMAQGVFSPNKEMVTFAGENGIVLYDVQTHALLGCLGDGRGPRPDLVFSSDSQFLIVAGSAGFSINLWQLAPDLRLIFSKNSTVETDGVLLSPNHQLLAILGWDWTGSSHYLGGTLKIWDVQHGQLVHEFPAIYALLGFTSDSRALEVAICTERDTVCAGTGTKHLSIYP